jgi:hypothetical protein
MLKIVLIVSIILILIIGFYWHEYTLPFNQVKCGSGIYVIYQDIENPYYMYDINNSKMFWKLGILAKSIQYFEEQNGITTILHIQKAQNIKLPNFNSTVDPIEYQNWIDNIISFLPENNILTDQDIENLKSCYPNAKMKLESNIKKRQIGLHSYKIGGEFTDVN